MSQIGIVPKVALTSARIANKPFEVPKELTTSSNLVGGAAVNFLGASTAAAKESYKALQPQGPAKLLLPAFDKVLTSAAASNAKAAHNVEVTWKPLALGSIKLGEAVTGPGVSFYASKAGFADPHNPDLISLLLHEKGYRGPKDTDPGQAPPATPPASGTPAPPTGKPAPKVASDSPQEPTTSPTTTQGAVAETPTAQAPAPDAAPTTAQSTAAPSSAPADTGAPAPTA